MSTAEVTGLEAAPAWFRPWAEPLARLQRTVADRRWWQSTGQDDPREGTEHTELSERAAFLRDGCLVRTALDHGDPTLAGELVAWYFRSTLVEATDALRRSQRTTTATLGGRDLTHSQLVAAGRQARDPAERAAAAAALREVELRGREARQRWLDAYDEARRRLGFDDHGAFVRALHPEVDRWVEHAESWLEHTRSEFLDRWRYWQARDAIGEPRPADTATVAARTALPAGAPDGPEAIRETLRRWGFADALDGIDVDLDDRPGKAGFAFCSPVDPPRDVRISVRRGRTLSDHAKMLHEFGHGLHFTVAVEHPFQIWCSHPARREAVGFALERVVEQRSWQMAVLGAPVGDEDVERTRFTREATRRTVAVGLLHEMARHDGATDPDRLFVELYERELGVVVDPVSSLNRLQTYLEAQPCYPLAYHQAFAAREAFWDVLQGHGPDWFLDGRGEGAVRDLITLGGRMDPPPLGAVNPC